MINKLISYIIIFVLFSWRIVFGYMPKRYQYIQRNILNKYHWLTYDHTIFHRAYIRLTCILMNLYFKRIKGNDTVRIYKEFNKNNEIFINENKFVFPIDLTSDQSKGLMFEYKIKQDDLRFINKYFKYKVDRDFY